MVDMELYVVAQVQPYYGTVTQQIMPGEILKKLIGMLLLVGMLQRIIRLTWAGRQEITIRTALTFLPAVI